ncbi:LiaF transmembrane domain-containing protein [Eubacterium sp.]
MKERRVGTFTFGISLILFGVLFLIKTIFKSFNYAFIFHMWPIMLIMLGGEIIYYTVRFNDKHFKYDIGGMFMICFLILFAMGMAGVEFLMDNYPQYIQL